MLCMAGLASFNVLAGGITKPAVPALARIRGTGHRRPCFGWARGQRTEGTRNGEMKGWISSAAHGARAGTRIKGKRDDAMCVRCPDPSGAWTSLRGRID